LERGLFRPNAVRKLFAEHRAGLRDNSNRIWRLLNLELWMRIFIDRDPSLLGASGHGMHETTGVSGSEHSCTQE
jgi:asparagine synthase (glutamine-hydrolysing)